MIINPTHVYYFTHDTFEVLENCILNYLDKWDDHDYYAIQFLHGSNLTKERLDIAFPQDIRDRVKNGELKVLLGNQQEAFHDVVDDIYKIFIMGMEFPEESLLFLTSSPNIMPAIESIANKYNKKTIKTIWCRVYEHDAAAKEIHVINSSPVNKTNKVFSKKYICLNRRWRIHRPALVGILAVKNLLDQGYVSLADCEGGNWDHVYDWIIDSSRDEEFTKIFVENRELITSLPLLYVDTITQNRNNDDFRPELQPFYDDTYFSVVTETPFFTVGGFENNIHLSEKTFKVLTQRHPFILADTPYALKAFKSLGYKTFSPFIDESYDEETNDSTRLLMIANEIEKLCKLEGQALQDFIIGCRDICEFNYNHLLDGFNNPGRYCTPLN